MYQKARMLAVLLILALLCTCVGCGASSETETTDTTQASESTTTESEEASTTQEETVQTQDETEAVAEEAQTEETVQEEEAIADTASVSKVQYPLSDETITLSLFISVSPMVANLITTMNDIVAYDEAEKATNVHLDAVISTPETTSEKFQIMIASSDYTDIIHGAATNYSGGLDKAISDEVLIDLNPYMEDYAPNYSAFLDSNETAKKLYTTESGYMAAIQGLSYSFVQGAIIRDDWLEDLGLEVPETIDELETVLTAFKTEKGATNSVLFTTGNIYLAGSFNVGAGTGDGTDGAVYNVTDGVVTMSYFEDAYYDFIDTLARWNRLGLFSTDFVSLFGAGVADAFVLSDDCGYWYGAQDNLGTDYADSYTGTSDHFSTLPVALVTQEAGQTIDTGNMIATSGEQWSVTSACETPEIAVAYLDWFFSEDGTLVCNYGREGEAFEYDEDGVPVYTELITDNPDGLSSMQAQWIYCNFQAPYVQDDARNDSLYKDEVQRNALSIWSSNRTDEKAYYGELTSEEAETYNTYAADLETYAGEQLLKFILNQEELTEESWQAFLQTLIDMHAEEMVELKQAAYDRYLSK